MIKIIYEGVRGTRIHRTTVDEYIKSKMIHCDGNDEQKFVSVSNFIDNEVIE